MSRAVLHALVPVLLPVGAALAQTQPVRVLNAGPLSATGLFVAPTGTPAWSANMLGGQFLPPGAFLSLQLGEGTGCRFDLRLVLRDGREALRRNVDVCAERVVEMVPEYAPAPPVAPPPAAPVGRGRP